MSQFFDDSTRASNPGRVRLSAARLGEFKRQLDFLDRYFGNGGIPAGRFEEHLMMADGCAAMVVTIEPKLLVAAYSGDLDAVTILRLPGTLVARYRLSVGRRLLSVNSYFQRPDDAPPGSSVAVDLRAGPGYSGWFNFYPLIADFLCQDELDLAAAMNGVSAGEWERVAELAGEYMSRFPGRCRDGNPYRSHLPV